MLFQPFLHIIYAYMVTFYLFVWSKYKIPRYVPYTANKPKNTEIWILAKLPSPTLKKHAFGNILLDVASGEKPKYFFPKWIYAFWI